MERAERKLTERLIAKIRKLMEELVPRDAKIIEGSNKRIFRVRVGDYRILYEIYYEEKLIVIAKIDKRERVY